MKQILVKSNFHPHTNQLGVGGVLIPLTLPTKKHELKLL